MRTEQTTVTGASPDAVIRELGSYAVERGYATGAYVDAVLEREAEFPTGLEIPNKPFDIAIPHADPDHVREAALILGLPERPVQFRNMNDPDRTVDASVVLLLLARDSDRYATFLGNLATLFQHPDFEDAVAAEDAERLIDLVESECL